MPQNFTTTRRRVVVNLADNIFSPLGATTADNLEAVMAGRSGLALRHEVTSVIDDPSGAGRQALPSPCMASLFAPGAVAEAFASIDGGRKAPLQSATHEDILPKHFFTRFEQMAIVSAARAIDAAGVDPQSPQTIFVLSSTKGNVGLLDPALAATFPAERVWLGTSAAVIARFFGNPNPPVVISNACISGVCALITARRALLSGRADVAVVIGADEQSRFIISGFSSFKALSPTPCRPFDARRDGLNLGEAAATIVLGCRETAADVRREAWILAHGAIRNDANHISGPSRTGEGSYRALVAAINTAENLCAPATSASSMRHASPLAVINAHGTATAYNDEMESIAIHRAGLSDVPVNALKGYFGHTMGAAGVLETALSMAALSRGVLIGTCGYAECGVSHPLRLCSTHQATRRRSFVKLLSGFGGCNAALLCQMAEADGATPTQRGEFPHDCRRTSETTVSAVCHGSATASLRVHITPTSATLNGRPLATVGTGRELLTALYRTHVGDYPKFFKMDPLARLGFLAAELLLRAAGDNDTPRDDRAVILFGRTGSLADDRRYQATLGDGCFPSPAVFVYTLPNIVTGEIAIRHKYFGETSFYLLNQRDDRLMAAILSEAFQDAATRSILGGWVDCTDDDTFEADIALYTPSGKTPAL